MDGIHGDYESGGHERRPKYLNEAFWPDQRHADDFRQWLMSDEGKDLVDAPKPTLATTTAGQQPIRIPQPAVNAAAQPARAAGWEDTAKRWP